MAPSSAVWLYFTRKKNELGQVIAKCVNCQKRFVYLGSPSTLRTHLERAHNIVLPKLTPKGGRPSPKRRKTQETPSEGVKVVDEEVEADVDDPEPLHTLSDHGDALAVVTPSPSADIFKTPSRRSRPRDHEPPTPVKTPTNTTPRGTLFESWKEMTSFSEGGQRHDEVTQALLFMISHDDMPLRTAERTGFKVFCRKLNPRYKVPCEKTTTKKLHEKYQSLRTRTKKELGDASSISLTMDIWTSKKMESFLGVTAHYLKGIYLKSVELTAKPIKEAKTIPFLKEVILNICDNWNINLIKVSAVITDGGANIKGACKQLFGDTKHISCFGHILNLIGSKAIDLYSKHRPSEMDSETVQPDIPEIESDLDDNDSDDDGFADSNTGGQVSDLLKRVKRIVKFFRQSERATSELKKNQIDAGKKEHETLKLVQEVRTRWNSAYDMVERFLKLSDHVAMSLLKLQRDKSTKSKPPTMLSSDDLDVLTEVRDLLRPLAQATAEVCADKSVTISKVIPLVNLMHEKINSFAPVSDTASTLKKKLLADLKTNFGNIEHVKIFACATLLDPRFKTLPFRNAVACAEARSHLGEMIKMKQILMNIETEETEIAPAPPATITEEDDLWNALDRSVAAKRTAHGSRPPPSGSPDELLRYLDLPNCDRKTCTNPFQYFYSIKGMYPAIYEVACDILPILVTSTPCERLFSHAGLIMSQLRSRLSGRHLDELVFLRSIEEGDWFSV